jgi:hypothetical protein
MTAGLEFLISWRFWLMLTGSTSAITLGTAGGHIAAVLYFTPMLDGSPDQIYSLLTGFLLLIFFTVAAWYIFGRGDSYFLYPKAYEIRLFLAVAAVTGVVVGLEALAIRRFFVDPILDGAASSNFTTVFGFVFGFGGGQWASKAAWSAMTGAGSDSDRSATPDLP